MHILFLTDNFPPESNAPATRTYEHAVRWIRAGHNVTVVTCFPNFPNGKVFDGYNNGWYSSEYMNDIKVLRVKTYMTANQGFLKRTLDYVSFMLAGSIAACFVRKPDVVIATSPQFFCGMAGLMVSFLRRKPFILEIRDIWPASIVALGVMQDSFIIRILERLEKLLYRSAETIVVVTHVFKDEIAPNAGDPEKIHVVLNGVNQEMFSAQAKNPELIDKYQLDDQFVVGYIGTHGMAHNLDNVVAAADALRHRDDLTFIFVGAGAERNNIERLVEQKQLKNVRMIPQQPRNLMPAILALCDLSLIPLRDEPLFATVIPSKLFESMAMGVPVLMALPEGEATSMVKASECGEVIAPANPLLMASTISNLADNPNKCAQYRQAGIQASEHYSRDSAAEKMLRIIKQTVNNHAN